LFVFGKKIRTGSLLYFWFLTYLTSCPSFDFFFFLFMDTSEPGHIMHGGNSLRYQPLRPFQNQNQRQLPAEEEDHLNHLNTPVRPHTHIAWRHVETACAKEAEYFCSRKLDLEAQVRSTGDPFLDWMFSPTLPYSAQSEMLDVSEVMDRMVQSFFASSMPVARTTVIFSSNGFISHDEGQEEKEPEDQKLQDINFVADSTAEKLASVAQDIPDLAQKLQQYGQTLVQRTEEGSESNHFGRRLTEMDAEYLMNNVHPEEQQLQDTNWKLASVAQDIPDLVKTLRQYGQGDQQLQDINSIVECGMIEEVQLPFGYRKNTCLRKLLSKHKLSDKCAHSIQELDRVNKHEIELENRHKATLTLINVYLLLLVVLLIFIIRKFRRNKIRRRLRHNIIQAIYSSPSLKRQVEEELGESVGHTPPIPYLALNLMGARGEDFRRRLKCMKRLHICFFTWLVLMVFVTPILVLIIGISITFLRILLMCLTNDAVSDECECCCCGTTTTNAARGMIREDQKGCVCCKGTGVCAPVGGGKQDVFLSKKAVYQGIPVHIV
jgi:hypothetical protein